MAEHNTDTASDAIRDPKVRSRVMTLCARLDLDKDEGVKALTGDQELIEFAHRTGESLDWLLCGDATARIHLPRKPGPKKIPDTPEGRLAFEFKPLRPEYFYTDAEWDKVFPFIRMALASLAKGRPELRKEVKAIADQGIAHQHRLMIAHAHVLTENLAKAMKTALDRNWMVLEELGIDISSNFSKPTEAPAPRPKPQLRLVKG